MIDNNIIVFNFKKSYSISYNNDYFCCVGGSVNLYDIYTGAHRVSFTDIKQPCYSQFTMDNKLFVKAQGGYYVYDLYTFKLERRIPRPRGVKWGSDKFCLTPDNKYIIDFAEVFPESQLMVINIISGDYTLNDLHGARVAELFYNKSESRYYIASIIGDESNDCVFSEYYCFDYPFDKLQIKKLPFCLDDYAVIDYHNGKFAVVKYNGEIIIYDSVSKTKENFGYDKDMVLHSVKWSESGRYLALTESGSIVIIDITTKSIAKTYEVDYGCFADFYDNDTKLLIGTWEKGYCVDISSLIEQKDRLQI